MDNDIIRRYGKRDIQGYLVDDIIEDGLFGDDIKTASDWDICVIDHSNAAFFYVFAMEATILQGGKSRTCKCISDIFEPDKSYWRLSNKDRCQKKAKAFGMTTRAIEARQCSECLRYCIRNKKRLKLPKRFY